MLPPKIKLFMESKTESIFLDTSFFKALIDERDEFHLSAKEIWAGFWKSDCDLFTSNYVLDEALTLIRIRCGLEKAVRLKEGLLAGLGKFKIMRISLDDERNSWSWFLKDWSGLSFTDCTSFVLMQRLGISRVATFDKHFARAGFKVEK